METINPTADVLRAHMFATRSRNWDEELEAQVEAEAQEEAGASCWEEAE